MRIPWVSRRKLERARAEVLSAVMRVVRYKGELKDAKVAELRVSAYAARLEAELAEAREAGVTLEARAVQAEAKAEDLGAAGAMVCEHVALFRACMDQLLEAGKMLVTEIPSPSRFNEGQAVRAAVTRVGGAAVAVSNLLLAAEKFAARAKVEAERRGITRATERLALERELGGLMGVLSEANKQAECDLLKVSGSVQ